MHIVKCMMYFINSHFVCAAHIKPLVDRIFNKSIAEMHGMLQFVHTVQKLFCYAVANTTGYILAWVEEVLKDSPSIQLYQDLGYDECLKIRQINI